MGEDMNTDRVGAGRMYALSLIFSILFAVTGFSYNVWRMEVTEQNSNIRTASFEMLLVLASLEQSVYAAYYDQDSQEGSPRKGWVRVGLIADLSMMTAPTVVNHAADLKQVWSDHWESIEEHQESVDAVVEAIDQVRADIKRVLAALE
jgi:hypothetical protein